MIKWFSYIITGVSIRNKDVNFIFNYSVPYTYGHMPSVILFILTGQRILIIKINRICNGWKIIKYKKARYFFGKAKTILNDVLCYYGFYFCKKYFIRKKFKSVFTKAFWGGILLKNKIPLKRYGDAGKDLQWLILPYILSVKPWKNAGYRGVFAAGAAGSWNG